MKSFFVIFLFLFYQFHSAFWVFTRLITSACDGQVYILVTSLFICYFFESVKSILHFGHFPGLSLITCGCIGQVYNSTCLVVSFLPAFSWANVSKEVVTAISRVINFSFVLCFMSFENWLSDYMD